MKTKSAIIPFRNRKHLEVLLVRNSMDTKWVIPKGTIEYPLLPHISATKEAYEEAGVLGKPHPIMVGTYHKNNQEVPTFLLEVDVELRHYDEEAIRRRQWVRPSEIETYLEDADLIKIVKRGIKCLKKNGTYFKYLLKTFCNQLKITHSKISNKEAILHYELASGYKNEVHILRYKSTLEISVYSSLKFRLLEQVPQQMATNFLLENSENKIGFWCIEKDNKGYHISRMYNGELHTLDANFFKNILESLVNRCDFFEQEFKKAKAFIQNMEEELQ